jgi:hypothetical protein
MAALFDYWVIRNHIQFLTGRTGDTGKNVLRGRRFVQNAGQEGSCAGLWLVRKNAFSALSKPRPGNAGGDNDTNKFPVIKCIQGTGEDNRFAHGIAYLLV